MHAFILFIRYVFGFPQKLLTLFLHLSKWKYNSSILEYFVETSTKQVIKQSELLKRHENTHWRCLAAGSSDTHVHFRKHSVADPINPKPLTCSGHGI